MDNATAGAAVAIMIAWLLFSLHLRTATTRMIQMT